MSEAIPPTDPDVDLRVPAQRGELRALPWAVLGLIAAGGAAGALGRHALSVALPHEPGGFAWATLVVNVSGCALIGVLMELLARRWPRSRFIRPFWGVGVLGGYTTFSAAVLDVTAAAAAGNARIAVASLAATMVGCLVAVWAAGGATAALLDRPVRERSAR